MKNIIDKLKINDMFLKKVAGELAGIVSKTETREVRELICSFSKGSDDKAGAGISHGSCFKP